MTNSASNSIYDLIVVGNGIAAQTFLWNLSQEERKSQNFSIAHVYSSELAPPCSLRTSATVSLNGIEEDVSPLGNDMREAFFLFDHFFRHHKPCGVEELKRVVIATNENERKKILRRYKTLTTITNDKIKGDYPGAEYNSYIISPDVFSDWLRSQIVIEKTDYPFFAIDLEKKEDLYYLKLQNNQTLAAKKILFATGAYSKIFEKFLTPTSLPSIEIKTNEHKNVIRAGSYLERDIDLGDQSFYLSIDGHQVLYRKNEHESKLVIGSVTTEGAYESPNIRALHDLLGLFQNNLTIKVGEFSDFKIFTGLRHKGPRRHLICEAMDESAQLFRINGLYKNGFTFSFLAAKRMKELIFSS